MKSKFIPLIALSFMLFSQTVVIAEFMPSTQDALPEYYQPQSKPVNESVTINTMPNETINNEGPAVDQQDPGTVKPVNESVTINTTPNETTINENPTVVQQDPGTIKPVNESVTINATPNQTVTNENPTVDQQDPETIIQNFTNKNGELNFTGLAANLDAANSADLTGAVVNSLYSQPGDVRGNLWNIANTIEAMKNTELIEKTVLPLEFIDKVDQNVVKFAYIGFGRSIQDQSKVNGTVDYSKVADFLSTLHYADVAAKVLVGMASDTPAGGQLPAVDYSTLGAIVESLPNAFTSGAYGGKVIGQLAAIVVNPVNGVIDTTALAAKLDAANSSILTRQVVKSVYTQPGDVRGNLWNIANTIEAMKNTGLIEKTVLPLEFIDKMDQNVVKFAYIGFGRSIQDQSKVNGTVDYSKVADFLSTLHYADVAAKVLVGMASDTPAGGQLPAVDYSTLGAIVESLPNAFTSGAYGGKVIGQLAAIVVNPVNGVIDTTALAAKLDAANSSILTRQVVKSVYTQPGDVRGNLWNIANTIEAMKNTGLIEKTVIGLEFVDKMDQNVVKFAYIGFGRSIQDQATVDKTVDYTKVAAILSTLHYADVAAKAIAGMASDTPAGGQLPAVNYMNLGKIVDGLAYNYKFYYSDYGNTVMSKVAELITTPAAGQNYDAAAVAQKLDATNSAAITRAVVKELYSQPGDVRSNMWNIANTIAAMKNIVLIEMTVLNMENTDKMEEQAVKLAYYGFGQSIKTQSTVNGTVDYNKVVDALYSLHDGHVAAKVVAGMASATPVGGQFPGINYASLGIITENLPTTFVNGNYGGEVMHDLALMVINAGNGVPVPANGNIDTSAIASKLDAANSPILAAKVVNTLFNDNEREIQYCGLSIANIFAAMKNTELIEKTVLPLEFIDKMDQNVVKFAYIGFGRSIQDQSKVNGTVDYSKVADFLSTLHYADVAAKVLVGMASDTPAGGQLPAVDYSTLGAIVESLPNAFTSGAYGGKVIGQLAAIVVNPVNGVIDTTALAAKLDAANSSILTRQVVKSLYTQPGDVRGNLLNIAKTVEAMKNTGLIEKTVLDLEFVDKVDQNIVKFAYIGFGRSIQDQSMVNKTVDYTKVAAILSTLHYADVAAKAIAGMASDIFTSGKLPAVNYAKLGTIVESLPSAFTSGHYGELVMEQLAQIVVNPSKGAIETRSVAAKIDAINSSTFASAVFKYIMNQPGNARSKNNTIFKIENAMQNKDLFK